MGFPPNYTTKIGVRHAITCSSPPFRCLHLVFLIVTHVWVSWFHLFTYLVSRVLASIPRCHSALKSHVSDTSQVFSMWILEGIYCSLVFWFFWMAIAGETAVTNNGHVAGLWDMSTMIYGIVVITVTLRICLETTAFTVSVTNIDSYLMLIETVYHVRLLYWFIGSLVSVAPNHLCHP